MKTYKIGDRFIENHITVHGEFVLCQVGPAKMVLMNMRNFNRYNDPVEVKDLFSITEDEFNQMSRPYGKQFFTLLSESILTNKNF